MTPALEPGSMLSDALVILGAAGIVIPLFARIRITPVIGFILIGVAVGPFGLGRLVPSQPWLGYVTITNPEGLEPLAEFGIVLLLFGIGLELSLKRLAAMRHEIFRLGPMELFGAAALIALGLVALGNSPATALALGLALALSSTALVLRIIDHRTPVGRAALGTLLFEDIALVPIIFLLGAMGRGAGSDTEGFLATLGAGAVVMAVLFLIGRFLLPPLFAQAARTKSPELFLAVSLLVVIMAALATTAVGLSPIVGALVAGIMIAETDYNTEVEAMIEPFRGLALGVFLITVGMELDLAELWARLGEVMVALMLVLVVKSVVTSGMFKLGGLRTGTATEAGILLASPSETTLIVLATALSVGLISAPAAGFWQMVTAVGLTITPLLALAGRWVSRRVDGGEARPPDAGSEDDPAPRVLVIGGGRVGTLVADMLTAHGKPYQIVESDPDLVSALRTRGYRAAFADAVRPDMLERFGAGEAAAVVLTMDQPVAARRIVAQLRAAHPELLIVSRARDVGHAAELYRAGASHAVPETLESSLQLSEAVLVDIGVAMGPVIASIHEKRDEFRAEIEREGALAYRPKLRTGTLEQ